MVVNPFHDATSGFHISVELFVYFGVFLFSSGECGLNAFVDRPTVFFFISPVDTFQHFIGFDNVTQKNKINK